MNDNIGSVELKQKEDEESSQTHRELPSLVIVPDMHDVHRVLRSRDEHLSWRAEHAVDKTREATLLLSWLHKVTVVRVPLAWTSGARAYTRSTRTICHLTTSSIQPR